MAHLYKSRLQNYAQKRNIAFPMYACEMQGPPHARQFKARVTIDGVTYEGPEFCSTLKDAEHAAAKVAFMILSPEGSQEDDCLYKSLLQELAQKKGLLLPVYATNRTGPPHIPCFSSTVEIAGVSFAGQEARTKKQAEMNAAKVAYTALTEGEPRANNGAALSNVQMVGPSSFASPSLPTVATVRKEPTSSLLTVATVKTEPSISKMTTTINNQTNYSIATVKKEPSANKMPTTINNQATYSIAKESEKTKGLMWMATTPNEDMEKHKTIVPPAVIHQSPPKATSNVISAAEMNIRLENLVIGPTQGREGSSSNCILSAGSSSNVKRNKSPVNSGTSNTVIDSGAAKSHLTKIVIRPHIPGMTYEGPIQVSDEEWVAMNVEVDNET